VWVKTVILIAFLGIIASLASSLFFLVKDTGDSRRTLRALTVRIGLSVGLFLFLIVLFALGIIEPHAVIPAAPDTLPGGAGLPR
jgi:hypothetical protein